MPVGKMLASQSVALRSVFLNKKQLSDGCLTLKIK
jgi:hypothetical protein